MASGDKKRPYANGQRLTPSALCAGSAIGTEGMAQSMPLLKDAPTGLLERAFRDYKDMSRVFLPLAQYGDSVLQTQAHVLLERCSIETYQTWSARLVICNDRLR